MFLQGRGLKLKFIIQKKKFSAGCSLLEKKLLRAAVYKKSPQNKQLCIQIYNIGSFQIFAGRKNAFAGHMRRAGLRLSYALGIFRFFLKLNFFRFIAFILAFVCPITFIFDLYRPLQALCLFCLMVNTTLHMRPACLRSLIQGKINLSCLYDQKRIRFEKNRKR